MPRRPAAKIDPVPPKNIDPTVEPVRYMKIPPFVEVYEITPSNIDAVGKWASASVSRDDQNRPIVILRRMPPPYNKGHVGEFVVRSGSGEYRIAKKDDFLNVYVVAPE